MSTVDGEYKIVVKEGEVRSVEKNGKKLEKSSAEKIPNFKEHLSHNSPLFDGCVGLGMVHTHRQACEWRWGMWW